MGSLLSILIKIKFFWPNTQDPKIDSIDSIENIDSVSLV